MLEVMQFYVSGFWTWAGLTVGGWLIVCAIAAALGGVSVFWRK